MTATPQRFTKRPVTIEAIQWDGTQSGATPIIDWILDHDHSADYWAPGEWDHETNAAYINITTLEGNMIASRDDWIIRGVQGEFYPCKDAIFRETYEPTAEHQEPLNADDPTLALAEQQRIATLALVEQQRIANLIALVAADPDGLGQSAYSALAAMSPDRRRTILDPDIAAALGIGDDDE